MARGIQDLLAALRTFCFLWRPEGFGGFPEGSGTVRFTFSKNHSENRQQEDKGKSWATAGNYRGFKKMQKPSFQGSIRTKIT